MVLGSVSSIGIGIMTAILPLMYVERGADDLVLQSVLLLISGVYYSVEILPAGCSSSELQPSDLRPARRPCRPDRMGRRRRLLGDVWPLLLMGIVFILLGLWAFGRASDTRSAPSKLSGGSHDR
jgi:ABC-2 type transport system permease protein